MRLTVFQRRRVEVHEFVTAIQLAGDPARGDITAGVAGVWRARFRYAAGTYVLDLIAGSPATTLNARPVRANEPIELCPGDLVVVGAIAIVVAYRVRELPIARPLDPVERELLAEIADHPDDDHAREVLADHWEERGDPVRAELLHQQSSAEPLDELVAQHGERWRAPAQRAGFAEDLPFARGFLRVPLVVAANEPFACDADAFRLSPRIYREVRAGHVGRASRILEAYATSPLGDGARVAIKCAVPWWPDASGLIDRERRIIARFDHPNLVKLVGTATRRDGYALVLAWAGTGLDALIDNTVPLGEARAIEIGRQVCAALAAAHATGVVHRDVRPGNILIDDDNHVTLIDFGSAHCKDAPHWSDNQSGRPARGVLRYLSPEQVRGTGADARSDLFALGVVLCEVISGHHPLSKSTTDLGDLDAIIAHRYIVPAASPGMRRLLDRLLSSEPDDRPTDADALAGALAALQ